MEKINKILLFLTFVLIYSSIIYLIGQKQETEMELDISNALLNDLIYPKYSDGTYASGWVWTTYSDGRLPEYTQTPICKISWNNSCTQHIVWSNQTLNGTTYIKLKIPINIADIMFAYLRQK